MQYRKPLSGAEGRWRERLKRWERSGLTITAFCQREGVSLPSFFQWRKRLESAGKRPRRAFVPVEVVADVERGHGPREFLNRAGVGLGLPPAADPRIEIQCGPLFVRVPTSVDDESLRQVLRLAREEAARC